MILKKNRDTSNFKDFIYVLWKSEIRIASDKEAVIIQIGARSDRDTDFAHIKIEDVANDPNKHEVYGSVEKNCVRDVYHYIDDDFNASRLLMGICEGRIGGWTAWPPHEHAEKKEEFYVFFNIGAAFSIQCVYEELNSPIFVGIVRDGDMVSIPKGFHPNVGCPVEESPTYSPWHQRFPETEARWTSC